jgi:hypothetical protein
LKAKREMLNLSSGGGNANYLRFSPQANAWTNSNNEEVQLKKVVFDFDNVTTGWLLLGTGVRDWQPDAAIGRKGAQPTPDHKRGFEVTFYNKEIGARMAWAHRLRLSTRRNMLQRRHRHLRQLAHRRKPRRQRKMRCSNHK